MPLKEMPFHSRFAEFCKAMENDGAFLFVEDKSGKKNVMTIGWSTIGVLWYEPVLQVLVRPTRHTHALLENTTHFSVSIPVSGMKKELAFCGSRSGRDSDKIAECKLAIAKGRSMQTSIVEHCDIYYECEIIHKNVIAGATLKPGIEGKYYPKKDYHTIYYGKILTTYETPSL